MKSITIFIFLIASLLADDNKAIPIEVMENIKTVARKGWSAAEEPLKNKFKNDGEKCIKLFLEGSKTPFTKDDSLDSIPKLHLTKADNYYGLAYAKYLENQEKTEEALNIYKSMLSGIKQVHTKGVYELGLIYTVVIERLVTDSLSTSIHQNIFDGKELRELKVFLKNHLLFDLNLFLKAQESEINYLQKICERDLVANYNHAKYIKESLNGIYDDETLNKLGIQSETMFQKICDKTIEKRVAFDKKLFKIASEKNVQAFVKDFNYEKKEFYKWLARIKQKASSELEKSGENSNNFIHAISSILFYTSTTPLTQLKLDLLSNIEANNRLLELLNRKTTNK